MGMGRLLSAVCVVCLASSSVLAQSDNNPPFKSREARAEAAVARLTSGQAMNEGATRIALRTALSQGRHIDQRDLLGLMLLCAALRRDERASGHISY
jgi:hypothetical protein